jgi:hypothetical protein
MIVWRRCLHGARAASGGEGSSPFGGDRMGVGGRLGYSVILQLQTLWTATQYFAAALMPSRPFTEMRRLRLRERCLVGERSQSRRHRPGTAAERYLVPQGVLVSDRSRPIRQLCFGWRARRC